MGTVKYRLFLLQSDGSLRHLLDTSKASLGRMARKLSRQFVHPVIAVIEYDEDSKAERFRYERGVLISRMP
jgi:hypothetical protein